MPAARAASMASAATSAVDDESAAKMPPVWNQREPFSAPKMAAQSKSPRFTWLMAVWPRSEQPAAARTPKPRSVKLRPLRTVRPTPSYGTQWSREVSTPPCRMRSSTRRPTGLSASTVATAVRRPKQRRRPRATLYSPPPSHTAKCRVVWMRPSPGSRRSITSPRLKQSQRRLLPEYELVPWILIQRSLTLYRIAPTQAMRHRARDRE